MHAPRWPETVQLAAMPKGATGTPPPISLTSVSQTVAHLVARHGFADGRHVWNRSHAFRRGDAQRAHLACLDVPDRTGNVIEHHLHLTGEEVGERGGRAAVRHVNKHEPVSDIDTGVADSLKVLDPRRPIREADIDQVPCHQSRFYELLINARRGPLLENRPENICSL
jgi:hypothetical protein